VSALLNALKASIAVPPTTRDVAGHAERSARPVSSDDQPSPPPAKRSGPVSPRNDSARRLMLMGDLVRDVPVEGLVADLVGDELAWSIGRFNHSSSPVPSPIDLVASPKGEAV
jgi:hypothetical protein